MKRKLASWFSCAVLLCLVLSISVFADSNARIVRLSSVEGDVQIDRGTGDGFEKAFLNMPVTEGVRLSTRDDGRAEVEFEDGSTIHLAPGTILQFTELSLRSSGAKVSTVDVQHGKAYFDFRGQRADEFTVTFQHEKVDLTKAAHFRLNVDNDRATLAVFKGDLRIAGPSGEVEVGKRETAIFDLGNNDRYELARNIEEDLEDAWDKEQSEYHERYTASNSYDAPYSYGLADLTYYGNYYNVPGYGMCWRPFFTGLGWDPFMDGAWMWYPGFGYTWVSAYPWGWTPYHYGSWIFAPGFGWVWRPGLSWVSWNYVPRLINPPVRYVAPRPPLAGTHTTVIVGRGPSSSFAPGTKVVVKSDDAGIGVPRGIHNLAHVNREVRDRGSAAVETFGPRRVMVSPPSPSTTSSPARATSPAAASGPTPSTPRSAPIRPAGPRVTGEGGFRGGERMSAPAPRMPSGPSAPAHSSTPSRSTTSPHR